MTRKGRFSIEEKEKLVTEFCPNCKKKGVVLVRVDENHLGLQVLASKINFCKNSNCFRHLKTYPKNWVECNNDSIEQEKRKRLEARIYDRRERERSQGQRHAKTQTYQKTTVDGSSAVVSSVEKQDSDTGA